MVISRADLIFHMQITNPETGRGSISNRRVIASDAGQFRERRDPDIPVPDRWQEYQWERHPTDLFLLLLVAFLFFQFLPMCQHTRHTFMFYNAKHMRMPRENLDMLITSLEIELQTTRTSKVFHHAADKNVTFCKLNI